jgi:Mo-dependent nitrogenase C-terminus
MNASDHNTEEQLVVSWGWVEQPKPVAVSSLQTKPAFDWFLPFRNWLDGVRVQSPALAHRLCRLIPSQCPFERDVTLFGRTLFHIPPLCKLNPLYEEVVALRFRALCYLADDCGEDVSQYC